jgi:hypothetical protein
MIPLSAPSQRLESVPLVKIHVCRTARSGGLRCKGKELVERMETPSSRSGWPYVLPDRRTQEELQGLNLRFVELIVRLGAGADAGLGLDAGLIARIGRLRPARKQDLASCPYALHGMSLHDEAFWSAPQPMPEPPPVNGLAASLAPAALKEVQDFLFVALAYGWHLAETNPVAARWMLGANAVELARLTALPFTSLRQIAQDYPGLLRARLWDRRRFWEDLVEAVESGSRQARFAAVSLGLQLSAAAGTTRALPPKR